MENFLFDVSDIFTFFDTDKAVALIFDLGSIKETTDTEEAGLFSHTLNNKYSNKYVFNE
jgi:hypothetical protein